MEGGGWGSGGTAWDWDTRDLELELTHTTFRRIQFSAVQFKNLHLQGKALFETP